MSDKKEPNPESKALAEFACALADAQLLATQAECWDEARQLSKMYKAVAKELDG